MESNRGRYIFDKKTGKWIPWELCRKEIPELHYVQDDTMDPLLNHANGAVYDSKSAFRRGTTDAGCIEVGDAIPGERARGAPEAPNLERDLHEIISQGPDSWQKAFGSD